MKLSIVTIGVFVAMLNQGMKYFDKNIIKKDLTKWLPVFSIVFGVILGIIGYYMPDVEMGSDLLEAIFIGASSGSASTGVHQIYKQQVANKDDSYSSSSFSAYKTIDNDASIEWSNPDENTIREEYDEEVGQTKIPDEATENICHCDVNTDSEE